MLITPENQAKKIKSYLIHDLKVEVYEELTSTFSLAGRAETNSLVVTRNQTMGRGTKDRTFFCDFGGIYMSVCLPAPPKLSLVTPAAGVAVTKAIKTILGLDCSIKWVNDVKFNDKKVCGILTRAYTMGEKIKTVTGIGINYCLSLPKELLETATSLVSEFDCDEYMRLIASVADNFVDLYDKPEVIIEYRNLCQTLGKTVYYDGKEYFAKDVNDDGELIAEYNGKERVINTGEIFER